MIPINPKHLPSFFALLLILFGGSFLYFMAPERPPEMKFYTSTISYNIQEEVSLDFTDISSGDWFYSYLQTLVSEGVVDNASAPFRPDDSLNRAELVKIVIELLGEPILSPANPSFQDVSSGSWYFGYVETAADLGIVEGYRDADGVLTGYFGPADTVNRAQAVKILIKAFSLESSAGSSTFPDVSASAWYAPYVSSAATLGIVNGYENGNFGPGDAVTRAQITKIAVKSEEAGGGGVVVDADGDGDGYFPETGDCDDANAAVHPYASETCGDGTDQDCSGADLSCNDVDNDGDSYTENDGDCNDSSSTVYPGAPEVCGDGIDQNCDSQDTSCDTKDNDGDGYSSATGDCDDTRAEVHPGASEIAYSGLDEDCDAKTPDDDLDGDSYRKEKDCSDSDATRYPGATEKCGDSIDQDCSGADLSCKDVDDDKDGYTENQGDCNDTSASIKPSAVETCGDSVDQNCDGKDLSCNDVDNDSDGYTETAGDCNDADASIYPGVSEKCDSIDNDCDWQKDEGLSTDSDKDGYTTKTSCEGTKNDCDDSKASVYVGATETCGDGIDQDCSGADLTCSKVDNDKDGYSTTEGDCDDSNASIHPGATETCDGVDNDCDSQKDDGLTVDADKDGYSSKTSCEGTKNDCDDSKASVYVGATETCGDGIDQDCSGADLSCNDVDNDSDGYTENQGDCNDASASVKPGATETCGDGIDQNCSGKDLPCATANPCDSIEGINEDVCSGYYTASEEYVCACPVAKASASDPFCEIPSNKSSAQLYFTSSYSNDLYQYKKLGTKYIPYHQYFGSVSFNGSNISYEETGRMDTFIGSCSDSAKENCPYYSWVEAVPSPSDAAFLALYEQADNLLSDGNSANDDDVSGIDKKARYAGIAGCASGSNSGFRLDHFLQNLTAPLVRWGSKTGSEREMYAMISDMYRFLFAPSIQSVTQTGSGSAIDAMVVKSSTLLGRTSSASTAFADFDVTFQSGKDTYAVFLESLPPSEGIYDYSNELAITRINLMDLNNCDFSRCNGDSSVKFCCKTAVLIESTFDFWPTNPALSDNGELISFNRFGVSLGMFGDPYSQYYVMKNPFKNSTLLGSCVTSDGQDGFGKPIDCTPLISKSDGTFDYNECPNYSCCGSSGVSCSTCVSVGRNNYDGVTDGSGTVICDDNSDALRSLNWVVFLKQSSNDYVTYFSKTAGNAIDEDFYKIRLSGDQFVLDTPGVVPLTRLSITDFEVMTGVTFQDFLLAPFRK